MSEKRDLWVSLVLLLGGLGVLAWNVSEGRPGPGLLAAVLGLVGAIACLPIRVRFGQMRNVLFGTGVALLIAPLAPHVAPGFPEAVPWIVAAAAFLAPIPTLSLRARQGLLVGAGLAALFTLLGLLGLGVPPRLVPLFAAGALYLAVQSLNARERKKPAPPPGPRVCVMGGSFDPFHVGHRALAEAALRACDRLLVVPAGRAPHKLDAEESTSFHHRVAMARLGVEGLGRIEVLELEGRRSGPSYTVDTLEVLRRTWPAGTRFFLLVGADMLQDFPTWREWDRILEAASLLVAERPGFTTRVPDALAAHDAKIEHLEAPRLDVSSTAIRTAYREGRSVEDLVSPAVRAYIRDHGLYTSA